MPAHPVQIHILITHDSGRAAERTYMRDDDGWALLTRLVDSEGKTRQETEDQLEMTNEALFDALQAVHAAFGTMRVDGDAPFPELIPVDTRPQVPGAMN